MSLAMPLREDFDAMTLRRLAKGSKDAAQTRRLRALAAIDEGASRCRTAFARASMAGCEMNYQRKSFPWPRSCPHEDRQLGQRFQPASSPFGAGYRTPAADAATHSAMRDRLRNPDQWRRSHNALPTLRRKRPRL
jgi:hypothetical protein